MTTTLSIASVVWAVVAFLVARQVVTLASSVLAARHAQQAHSADLERRLGELDKAFREGSTWSGAEILALRKDVQQHQLDLTRLKNLEGID